VKTAQANYNETAAPAAQTDVDTAKAQVASAQAAADAAQLNLDSAVLTAPFDGTIAAVNGSVGQWISGGTVAATNGSTASATAIFTLMDLNNLQVVSQVNEADISKVQIGNTVNFDVSAFPNKTFTGKVLSIQPVGTTSSNVVNYNVTSSIQSADKSTQLYPGMTATVSIVTAERDNVLTVPNNALTFAQKSLPKTNAAASAKSSAVLTLVGNQTKEVPVTVGLSDGTATEIVAGLNPGDVVVTGTGTATTTRSATSTTRTTTSSPLTSGGAAGGPPPGGP
jgi:HlyD family secretion protein